MINVPTVTAPSFLQGLACMALPSGLRSAIVFDASPLALQAAAEQLADMLRLVTNQSAEVVTLGATETEESLWGTTLLREGARASSIMWGNGRLTQSANHPRPKIVVIPDLARAGLPVTRAGVTLIGAPSATLQRNGQNVTWQPDLWWIASCSYREVGEISPHLLDRFSLRFFIPETPFIDREDDVYNWAMDIDVDQHSDCNIIPDSIRQQILSRGSILPNVSYKVISSITTLFGSTVSGSRREIALAQLSRAIAQLENCPKVTKKHVSQAAKLFGLSRADENSAEHSFTKASHLSDIDSKDVTEAFSEDASLSPQKDTANVREDAITPSLTLGDDELESEYVEVDEPVMSPNEEIVFSEMSVPASPYPEDYSPVTRSENPLKLPPKRYQSDTVKDGVIIGTKKADRLHDIAIVSTVLEAAKFQRVRYSSKKERRLFQLRRTDLRSYRRSPMPQKMLVVLLDYTSLKECAWEDSILPHLSWAYVTRASVSIVKVGACGAKNLFRAEQVSEHSLLSYRISAAFEGKAGSATPLAHGLDLVMRTLQAVLHQGRGRTQEARFVIISDGRGNIPLEASQSGELTQPVYREGIEDALAVANKIGTLKQVETFFLNPQPEQYSDLPIILAEALGVVAEPIRIQSPEEVSV